MTIEPPIRRIIWSVERPEEHRRHLYYGALAQFVTSERCKDWSDEERREALRLARGAVAT